MAVDGGFWVGGCDFSHTSESISSAYPFVNVYLLGIWLASWFIFYIEWFDSSRNCSCDLLAWDNQDLGTLDSKRIDTFP